MATSAFDAYEGQVRRFVVFHMLTMGLGGIREGVQSEVAGAVPGCNTVKQMLQHDQQLQTEIVDEVRMIFDAAAADGRVRPDDAAPWLRQATAYVTWRHAGRRARDLFREPLGRTESVDEATNAAHDAGDGGDPESALIAAEARAELARRIDALFAVLPRLSPADQDLVRGRLAGESYEAIAARLGEPEERLRLRMHRMPGRLRPLVEAELDAEEGA